MFNHPSQDDQPHMGASSRFLTAVSIHGDPAASLAKNDAIPPALQPFCEPALLPGESLRDYQTIRRSMIEDIAPNSNIEWLWAFDLIELSWEILRYRKLKERTLQTYRAQAIEALLLKVDGEGMPPETWRIVQLQAQRNAAQWRDEPLAADEIEAHLARRGIDNLAINAEVFVQARDIFALFDSLMISAQARRIALFREIGIRREFAVRAQRVSERIDQSTKNVEPKLKASRHPVAP